MSIAGKQTYQCVHLPDFLRELAKKIKRNSASWDNLQRMYIPPAEVPDVPPGDPLRTNIIYKHLQKILSNETAVMAETGDSWFNCQKLKLPDGCGYEFQVRSTCPFLPDRTILMMAVKNACLMAPIPVSILISTPMPISEIAVYCMASRRMPA